ncbi:MAG: acetolactate decarboxylase [Syntrophomonadaceae bacterium]
MRNRLIGVLTVLLVSFAVLPAFARTGPPPVMVDGKPIASFELSAWQGDELMVPLRAIVDAFDGTLEWNADLQTTTVSLCSASLKFKVGDSNANINGSPILLPEAPFIAEGALMVPLSVLSPICGERLSAGSATGNNSGTAPLGRETLYQMSTITSLLAGAYDGQIAFEVLRQYGDLGIGTFDKLDGEMIEVDGNFYQIKADGTAHPVAGSTLSPFAAVTYFDPDQSIVIDKEMSLAQLQERMDKAMLNKNMFYAIKITGDFPYVKTRSVPAQKKPYPRLADITKNQPTFELKNVKGTLVGFWCPAVSQGVNVPGFHLHFLSEDKTAGGHLLDLSIAKGSAQLDATPCFFMALPLTDPLDANASNRDVSADLEKVEKGK